MMNEFEITWIKNPVEDILGIVTTEFTCKFYCLEKTSESCGTFCSNYES